MKVSISQLKQFKACRRAWYLHYVENLEPVAKSDALTVGTNYHALLETLYKDGKLEDVEPTKEAAMAKAYEKYIFPAVKVELAEELGVSQAQISRIEKAALFKMKKRMEK